MNSNDAVKISLPNINFTLIFCCTIEWLSKNVDDVDQHKILLFMCIEVCECTIQIYFTLKMLHFLKIFFLFLRMVEVKQKNFLSYEKKNCKHTYFKRKLLSMPLNK